MQKSAILTLLMLQGIAMQNIHPYQLKSPSNNLEQYRELAAIGNDQLPELWNNLAPEERIFTYYMFRASVPGNRIIADQTHRHSLEIIDLFQKLVENQNSIRNTCTNIFDAEQFIQEAELFAVYLLANHGQYFLSEFENNKRTPDNLELHTLTKNNIIAALKATGIKNAQEVIDKLEKTIFDATHEPTVTVDGSIEKSASNMYSPDFTEQDFQALNPSQRVGINNYFYIEYKNGKRVPSVQQYKIGGRYSQELEVAHHWLTKAHKLALQYPNTFDENIPASLESMLKFIETGNEDDFKKFCIKWLKSNSRLDFNFGFIEVYDDPKQYRGSFEADITIKTVDMKQFNALLPSLEKQLPFPDQFKRPNLDDISSIPNASVNAKFFASGEAGPIKITAAYCLPNYSEIRSNYGSKQIIYQLGKSLGEVLNKKLSRDLHYCKEHAQWLETHDPEGHLEKDIWNLHVLLHETLGHGSGRLDIHTFIENDPMVIGDKQYNVGDTVQVTAENINEFVGRYFSGHEELRAEIIALYTSIFNFDELAANGLIKDWPNKIGKEKLIEQFIIHMAREGLRRLVNQNEGATEIVQAHSQADTTILNYLLDHGGLEMIEEKYMVDDKEHTVLDIRVNNVNQAKQAVKDLAIEVQRIKSTGDGQALEYLMKNYGTQVRHPEYITILKENRNAVQGNLKRVADIFPRLTPIYKNDIVCDIAADWPDSFLEQQLELNKLALSKS
ncbi:hypothetical protein A3F06_01515 [candidate division TM6 bacterium RIFCSPHIGHO2_12_FULL_36_22]|nr:MAG: hypothetical protein A3F06_01515 [candidate division TM6 bacterium RIFCSPHIGHO2_12_FULL_36_22]